MDEKSDQDLGHIRPEDFREDSQSVEVEETDLDGDGTVDLVTTTTRRHNNLRFGPGDPTNGWIRTEVEVGQCDEDHDGVDDWVSVTATERIHVDMDGDGSVDLVSITERVSHDFDGDGEADLVTTRIVEEVAVDDESTGKRRVVRTEFSRVEEPEPDFDPLSTPHLTLASPEAVRERIQRATENIEKLDTND